MVQDVSIQYNVFASKATFLSEKYFTPDEPMLAYRPYFQKT